MERNVTGMLAFILIACLSAQTAFAQEASPAQSAPPEIDLMEIIAASFDTDGDGRISEEEFVNFGKLAWLSMDSDSSRTISKEEFEAWDWGFDSIARDEGKPNTFAEVKADLFRYWDVNEDGQIQIEEIAQIARSEFTSSDTDGDGSVTGRQLANGSTTFNAMLMMLRPAPRTP